MSVKLEAHTKCEHGEYAAHPLDPAQPVLADGVNLCRGGASRLATVQDAMDVLIAEGGETIWWCERFVRGIEWHCRRSYAADSKLHPTCGWRLVFPIPEKETTT